MSGKKIILNDKEVKKIGFYKNKKVIKIDDIDSNGILTHTYLVHKRTLNHLAKLVKWLSCVVRTYLYGAFEYLLLPRHERVSEWIYIVWLNVKKLFAWSRCHIGSLTASNGVQTHNQLKTITTIIAIMITTKIITIITIMIIIIIIIEIITITATIIIITTITTIITTKITIRHS